MPESTAFIPNFTKGLQFSLRLVDPMIAYAMYNYHQFFPAQFICPYRIIGDSRPPFRSPTHNLHILRLFFAVIVLYLSRIIM